MRHSFAFAGTLAISVATIRILAADAGVLDFSSPASPESQGVSSAAISAYIDDAEKTFRGGDVHGAIHGFVLLRHGRVIAEGSWKPFDTLRETHQLYSHSKSFTSTAIGMLVDDAKLDLDDRVADVFADKLPADPGAKLRSMRIRDLLTMNTGMPFTDAENRDIGGDWEKLFMANEVLDNPGTRFRYDSCATYMLAATVERKTKMKLMDFLKARLFDPLGITSAWTTTSPSGTACGGWGMNMTTRDLAKFGQLYLQQGRWGGRQIVSTNWVRQATNLQTPTWRGGTGDWNQGYCFQFWRCNHNAFRADGAHGQLTVVMPDQDAVISVHAGLDDMQKELNLIWKNILPAFKPSALPEDPSALAALRKRCSSLELKPVRGARDGDAKFLGRKFAVGKNKRNLKSVSVVRDGDGWKMTVELPAGVSTFPLGYDCWKKGEVRFDTEKYERLGGLVGTLATAGSAAVLPDGKLHCQIYMTGTTANMAVTFSEKDGECRVDGGIVAFGGCEFSGRVSK